MQKTECSLFIFSLLLVPLLMYIYAYITTLFIFVELIIILHSVVRVISTTWVEWILWLLLFLPQCIYSKYATSFLKSSIWILCREVFIIIKSSQTTTYISKSYNLSTHRSSSNLLSVELNLSDLHANPKHNLRGLLSKTNICTEQTHVVGNYNEYPLRLPSLTNHCSFHSLQSSVGFVVITGIHNVFFSNSTVSLHFSIDVLSSLISSTNPTLCSFFALRVLFSFFIFFCGWKPFMQSLRNPLAPCSFAHVQDPVKNSLRNWGMRKAVTLFVIRYRLVRETCHVFKVLGIGVSCLKFKKK